MFITTFIKKTVVVVAQYQHKIFIIDHGQWQHTSVLYHI